MRLRTRLSNSPFREKYDASSHEEDCEHDKRYSSDAGNTPVVAVVCFHKSLKV
jgi:hypothetical protein